MHSSLQGPQGSPQPLPHAHSLWPDLALGSKVLISAEAEGKQGEENADRAKNYHSKSSFEIIAGSFAKT